MRRRYAWPLAVLLLWLSGCAHEINLAPVFTATPGEKGTSITALGPLVEKTPGHTAVRPLFYKEKAKLEVLYPLGKFTPEHSFFFPVYRSDTAPPEQGDTYHRDYLLAYWGAHQGQGYAGFFPVYGTMKHRFGTDEAKFVLWPLYQSSISDGIPTYSVLWPIFTYSPQRKFKVFPLYGREHSADEDYRYWLWPIFHYQRGTQNMDAVLPFYLHAWGPQNETTAVLWPLFTCNRDDAWNFKSMDMPWPLVRTASGAYVERRFWPFYWYKADNPNNYRESVLWPFYSRHYQAEPDKQYREQTTRILILGSYNRAENEGRTSSTTHAWPLYYAYRDPEISRWSFPNLIPLSDAGYRRNWMPLFTLASGERSADTASLDALWHTFRYTRDKQTSRLALSFLFSYEQGPDYRKVGFLSDLLPITWRTGTPDAAIEGPQK